MEQIARNTLPPGTGFEFMRTTGESMREFIKRGNAGHFAFACLGLSLSMSLLAGVASANDNAAEPAKYWAVTGVASNDVLNMRDVPDGDSKKLGAIPANAHGLKTLANAGAGALKVGPMAEALKVSRGSFYWHFRDIADFRAQLLQAWQEQATDRVIQDLEAQKDRPDRLKQLMRRAFATKRSLDRAIRSWAAEDREVAAIVSSVDARRVAYIARMLAAALPCSCW